MHTTRLFRNGNSQAVRIPADLAFNPAEVELEIERVNEEIRIRPKRRPLTGLLQKLADFSPDMMQEGREAQSQTERDPL